MKLAEALQERADLNRKIEQLQDRLSNNVLVQEGEQIAEDPEKLKDELDSAAGRLDCSNQSDKLHNDCGRTDPDSTDCKKRCAVPKNPSL